MSLISHPFIIKFLQSPVPAHLSQSAGLIYVSHEAGQRNLIFKQALPSSPVAMSFP
jgi:hypothetical protein